MTNERRGGRRPPPRPGGGSHGEFRPYRPRPAYGSQEEGAPRDFPPRDFTPRQGTGGQGRGGYAPRPGGRAPGGFAGRPAADEGGMAIRVDPRRLSLLKELAAAEDLRPGQLVQRWVEERLDAERSGEPIAAATPRGVGAERVQALEASLDSVSRRVDELAARLTQVLSGAPAAEAVATAPAPPAETAASDATPAPVKRRPGRPRKHPLPEAKAAKAKAVDGNGKVALHDEIVAVIREGGPATAAELATAIRERGHYLPPRSAKPLDAATVNSRVSNPTYRALFRRSGHKIGLAE